MPDCLCRYTGFISFWAQVRGLITLLAQGLICPKSGTGYATDRISTEDTDPRPKRDPGSDFIDDGYSEHMSCLVTSSYK